MAALQAIAEGGAIAAYGTGLHEKAKKRRVQIFLQIALFLAGGKPDDCNFFFLTRLKAKGVGVAEVGWEEKTAEPQERRAKSWSVARLECGGSLRSCSSQVAAFTNKAICQPVVNDVDPFESKTK